MYKIHKKYLGQNMNEATSLALHGVLWWERLMGTLFFFIYGTTPADF